MATGIPSGPAEARRRPKHWDKMVLAAYMRILGHTQKEAAEAVGRSERTIRDWEGSDLWREAEREAEENTFLRALKHAAMRAVLKNVDEGGNPILGWEALQRLMRQLAPKQRVEQTDFVYDPEKFTVEGNQRVAAGEAPHIVAASGGLKTS